MPSIALHQHRAAGIQQFGDQFKVFVELMDEQVVRQVQKLHPVVGAAHFAAWKAASTDGKHMP